MRSAHPFTVNCALKTEFFILISSDERATTSSFRVLAIFFLTLSGDSFGLLSWPLCPLLYPTRSQSVNISWLSFWPGFVTSAERNWPTFLIPLLTVNLWGLSIQTRRCRGKFLFLSSQRQTTWQCEDRQKITACKAKESHTCYTNSCGCLSHPMTVFFSLSI